MWPSASKGRWPCTPRALSLAFFLGGTSGRVEPFWRRAVASASVILRGTPPRSVHSSDGGLDLCLSALVHAFLSIELLPS